jgi:hypothetical protein
MCCWQAAQVSHCGRDVGIEGLYTTNTDELANDCHDAPNLPTNLVGVFLLAGPTVFEFKGYKFKQVNDGNPKSTAPTNQRSTKPGRVDRVWEVPPGLGAKQASVL